MLHILHIAHLSSCEYSGDHNADLKLFITLLLKEYHSDEQMPFVLSLQSLFSFNKQTKAPLPNSFA